MYYLATIHAYDALGTVRVAAEMKQTVGGPGDALETVLTVATTLDGVGEDEPARWLRDALVGLAETL